MSAKIQKIASQLEFRLPYHKRSHIFHVFWGYSLSNNFFLKSRRGFENWTFLKMSKNGNPKKVLKMTFFLRF